MASCIDPNTGQTVLASSLPLHAHLLGTDGPLGQGDLITSALLSILFFALAGYAFWRWFIRLVDRFAVVLLIAVALLLTGIAFAIRAAIANTNPAVTPQMTIIAEQCFFTAGQFLLIESHITLTRDLINRASIFHWPSTFAIISRLILMLSFGLSVVGFANMPDPQGNACPSLSDTQLRIAGAVLPFLITIGNALYLPWERVGHPEIQLDSLGLLILIAWFLFVPALYSFCAATISADTSPLVANTLFFYLSYGLFQVLAVLPLLILPLEVFFLPAPWLWGLRHMGEKIAADALLDVEDRALAAQGL